MNEEIVDSFSEDLRYVFEAQNSLLKKLFGFVPENPGEYLIERREYVKAIQEVKKEFGLEEGNPRFVLFVLEQLSRSPKVTNSNPHSKKYKIKLKR